MKNLILIGFMGAGKTSIGKLLSQRIGRPFVDIDQQIEKEAGCSIVEIFRCKGEGHFRRLEKDIISRECLASGKVISLGGGAFLDPQNMEVCLSGGNKVVFLNASWNFIRQRLEILKKSRPLLVGKSEEEVRAVFDRRQNVYKQAHFEVFVDDFKSFNDVAAHIDQVLMLKSRD